MNIRQSIGAALQITLVVLSAYLCGYYFTSVFHSESAGTGGVWAIMSAVVVLQATRRTMWSHAWFQVLGTLIGAMMTAAYLSVLAFSAIGLAATVLATVLLCYALRIPESARLAALAVGVVMVISSLHPTLDPLVSATLRFSEACIGAALAVLSILLWPAPARPEDGVP